MEFDPRGGYPASSPNTWHSPGYRGGGGGGQRFYGHKDDSFSPRQNWRGQSQWTPSPYRGGYRPNYRNSGPYTPRRGSPGFGYQQSYRPRNSSPRFHSTPYNQTDIENWISPQMWEDPWADLVAQTSYHVESFETPRSAEPYKPDYTSEPQDSPQGRQEPYPEDEAFVNIDPNTAQPPVTSDSVPDPDVLAPKKTAADPLTTIA